MEKVPLQILEGLVSVDSTTQLIVPEIWVCMPEIFGCKVFETSAAPRE